MAEPLADVFIDLDWMEMIRLKGAWIKLGWGLSVAVVSRVRAHELVKKIAQKESGKTSPQDRASGASVDRAKADDGGEEGAETTDGDA